MFNLETAVEREKDVQDIDVHGRFEKLVVTLLVMRAFSYFPGALRACAYFRAPTADSRFNNSRWLARRGVFLLLFAMHSQADVYVTGTAYVPGSDQILYIENYSTDSATLARVQYKNAAGELLAEKQLDFSHDRHAPDVLNRDLRLASVTTVTTQNNMTKVRAERNGEATLDDILEVEEKLVIDAGFNFFVQDRWSELVARNEINFRFLTPGRKSTIRLKLKRRDCVEPSLRVCLRIRAANWIIAAVMSPIDLEYAKSSRRLLRFTGIGLFPDSAGKSQKVDIHYRYPASNSD